MGTITNARPGIKFLLLLVFFQQIGAGLFIHNLLHEKVPAGQTPFKQNESSKETNFTCSCVDNFLMPFVGADEPPPLQNLNAYIKPVDSFTERLYFTSLIFSSLRGPPVFIG
jgi:hypothetical protein